MAEKWRKMSDNVSEIADSSVSFKSVMWKHFGFQVSRNEKVENYMQTLPVHIRHFFGTYCNLHINSTESCLIDAL